jgi:putative tricarboxylic transport membrane protein
MTGSVDTLRQRRRWLTVIGAVGCALAIAYTAYGMATLRFGTLSQPGAAIFPMAVGAILLATGILLIIHARTVAPDEKVDIPQGADRLRITALVGLFIAYAILLPNIGFIASTFIFLLLASRTIGGASWARCTILAALVSVGAFWIFSHELHVPLPRDAFLDLL